MSGAEQDPIAAWLERLAEMERREAEMFAQMRRDIAAVREPITKFLNGERE